jgi:hypothetical protein
LDNIALQMPFNGDVAKALDFAGTSLASCGFKITNRSAYEMNFQGPPQPQGHHEMSRFWGADAIKISQQSGALHLVADMGAFNKSTRLAGWIVFAMMAMGAIASALTVGLHEGDEVIKLILALFAGLFVFTWSIVWAVMRSFEARVKGSYETLLNNAVMLAQNR